MKVGVEELEKVRKVEKVEKVEKGKIIFRQICKGKNGYRKGKERKGINCRRQYKK